MTVTQPAAAPVRRVTVLYDDRCGLCRTARSWLERQVQVVPLEFVAAASPEAARRYPFLDPSMTLEDLTVVSDGGEVWIGAKAWVVCLWALQGRQGLAQRLSAPSVMPRARVLVSFVSRHRRALGTEVEACDCSPA